MILSIETSADPASVALHTDAGEVVKRTFPNNNQVNTLIADELRELLADHAELISVILVGSGPGSYSGARVGLATAEAMAITVDCPVVTLPSILGIDIPATLIGDARRGSYFTMNSETLIPTLYSQDDFVAAVAASPMPLTTFEDIETLPLPSATKATITRTSSSAATLINYWTTLSDEDKANFSVKPKEVIYLRPPNITKSKSPF